MMRFWPEGIANPGDIEETSPDLTDENKSAFPRIRKHVRCNTMSESHADWLSHHDYPSENCFFLVAWTKDVNKQP